MAQTDILYKVIALYLLSKSEHALSNANICEFFVEGDYTDYFTALSTINSLGETGLIDTISTNNVTTHVINEKGRQSLLALMDRISPETENEVESFLRLNDFSIKSARELISNYDKATFGGFMVHLIAREDDITVIDLSFQVSSEVQAKSICTNWKNNYEKVYESLMEAVY